MLDWKRRKDNRISLYSTNSTRFKPLLISEDSHNFADKMGHHRFVILQVRLSLTIFTNNILTSNWYRQAGSKYSMPQSFASTIPTKGFDSTTLNNHWV